MRVFVELFLVLFLIFAAITLGFYSLEYGWSMRLIVYMWSDLILTAVLAMCLTVLQAVSVNRQPVEGNRTLSFVQARELMLRVPYDEAMRRCLASLSEIAGYRLQEVSHSYGKIVAMVPSTWTHLGQIISFTVAEQGNDAVRVKLVSKPLFTAVRVDFGRNLQNVERIGAYLRAHAT